MLGKLPKHVVWEGKWPKAFGGSAEALRLVTEWVGRGWACTGIPERLVLEMGTTPGPARNHHLCPGHHPCGSCGNKCVLCPLNSRKWQDMSASSTWLSFTVPAASSETQNRFSHARVIPVFCTPPGSSQVHQGKSLLMPVHSLAQQAPSCVWT